MKLNLLLLAAAASFGLYACGPPPEAPEPAEAAVVAVPAAFIGTWSSNECAQSYVRIGASVIRHFYTDGALPLTSATASADGRLVVTYVDENVPVTDTFQLTDGKLDQVSRVTRTTNDEFRSEPMSPCAPPPASAG